MTTPRRWSPPVWSRRSRAPLRTPPSPWLAEDFAALLDGAGWTGVEISIAELPVVLARRHEPRRPASSAHRLDRVSVPARRRPRQALRGSRTALCGAGGGAGRGSGRTVSVIGSRGDTRLGAGQSTGTSAVSTSHPSAPTSTLSSIRMPPKSEYGGRPDPSPRGHDGAGGARDLAAEPARSRRPARP